MSLTVYILALQVFGRVAGKALGIAPFVNVSGSIPRQKAE